MTLPAEGRKFKRFPWEVKYPQKISYGLDEVREGRDGNRQIKIFRWRHIWTNPFAISLGVARLLVTVRVLIFGAGEN